MAGECSTYGEIRNVHKVLVGKSEGKRPRGRARRRVENIIRMDLRKTGWEGVNWMHLARDRNQRGAVVNTVMNFRGIY